MLVMLPLVMVSGQIASLIRCCPKGKSVNPTTMECSLEESGDLEYLAGESNGIQQQLFTTAPYNFPNVCEEGEPSPNVGANITSDGFVLLAGGEERMYACLDVAGGRLVAWTCPSTPACPHTGCLEKCCGEGQVFDFRKRCSSKVPSHLLLTEDKIEVNSPLVRQSDLMQRCRGRIYLLDPSLDDFHFMPDGRMSVNSVVTRNYCYDYKYNKEWSNRTEVILRSSEACDIEQPEPEASVIIPIYTSFASISLVFLVATFAVYWFIPEFDNLHGRIVRMNITSIVFVMVFIIGAFNTRSNLNLEVCTVLGYFGYFSTVSMFSWMTAMSSDLGWTFSRSERPRRSSDIFKFRLYSGLAWGLPTCLTILLATLQALLPRNSALNPDIGHDKCFLSWHSGLQPLYFFYVPVLALMVTNSVTFLVVVTCIVRTKRSVVVARKSSTSRVNSATLEQLVGHGQLT